MIHFTVSLRGSGLDVRILLQMFYRRADEKENVTVLS